MKETIFEQLPGLVCAWDFGSADPFVSRGKYACTLLPAVALNDIALPHVSQAGSLNLEPGQYLFIPRRDCAGLNISGPQAQVTVCAWVKRRPKRFHQCEAIAGMWNETGKLRQYCLFLNILLYESGDQVCGHISGTGGPTPGNQWCVDVSIGHTKLGYGSWEFVAFTYDGHYIRSWLNGVLDERPGTNPYHYPEGIFNGGEAGADFTVGAVHRLGEMGNDFAGEIASLAVYDQAVDAAGMLQLYEGSKADARFLP